MKKAFNVGGRLVGDGAPVFIVAELSANHGGSKDVALRTIEAAHKAGADAIKLQTYTPDTLTLASNREPFVVKTNNVWAGRTLHDLYAEAMTPWEWHAELAAYAQSLGLAWFSTPFDATATELLATLDAPAYKIASFELVDLPLIEHVARRGKPMIISTGMAQWHEIEAAVATCRGVGNDEIAVLRCVSSYPARPECMDLVSLRQLAELGVIIGLSDHTRDATAAITAVALGARIVEKHFIVDRSVGGPDAFFSLEPTEFASMVSALRDAERALGSPRFGVSEDEKNSVAFRRSLFFSRDVKKGQTLTCDDVRSVRPSHGLAPEHLPAVLGATAAADVRAATPLAREHVAARAPAGVTLRAATADDSAFFRELRNDPKTVAGSVVQRETRLDEHAAWFGRMLASQDDRLFVCEEGGARAGLVRMHAVDAYGTHEVGIVVAPTHRGRGLARDVLVALEEEARGSGVVRAIARIRSENERSIRAFKTAGYYGFIERPEGGAKFVWCERRFVPFAPH